MAWISNTKFRGMQSLRNATELPQGVAAYSLNSNLGSSSQAGPMKAYSKFGNQANATNKIVAKYTYTKQDGVEVMLHVRDDATNYILEYLNTEDVRNSENGEWTILEAGLSRSVTLTDDSTRKAHFGFAPFNDSGSNQLVYGNGVETRRIWNGATAEISATTANTITIDGTATITERGFSATGTLIINGNSYTYTGVAGGGGLQFTGVSGDPTGEANGSGIAQKPDSTTLSALDNSSILLSTQARLFQAGITATPNQVTYTDIGDLTSESGSDPSSGGFEDFPQMNGDITALSYIDNWILVFSEKKIIAFRFDFPSSTTRTVIRKDIADEGCSNPKAIKKMGDQVWYITPKGGIKRITQIASENVFNVEDITDGIRPTIKNFVWDEASLEYSSKDRVFIAAGKSDSDQTANNRAIMVWMSLNEEGNLQANIGISDWCIGDMCIYNNDLHFGSSLQSEGFKGFDGYSKNGAPYIWRRTERIELFGDAWERKFVKFLGIAGSLSSDTTLKITLKYGVNGSLSTQEMEITGTDTDYVVQQPLNVLGGFELGTEPLGGTIDDIGDLNPFEVVFPLPHIYTRNVQVEFETDGSGQQVSIDYYSFYVENAEQHITAPEVKELGAEG